MADVFSKISEELDQPQFEPDIEEAGRLIAGLVQEDAYLGDVYPLSYADALVQIHAADSPRLHHLERGRKRPRISRPP